MCFPSPRCEKTLRPTLGQGLCSSHYCRTEIAATKAFPQLIYTHGFWKHDARRSSNSRKLELNINKKNPKWKKSNSDQHAQSSFFFFFPLVSTPIAVMHRITIPANGDLFITTLAPSLCTASVREQRDNAVAFPPRTTRETHLEVQVTAWMWASLSCDA